ncbi:hypothetical protein LC557_06575 [Fusobacterium necrophorum]|uniref:hypothetical protein n=1 Tax=Fusobacterium necrophorum TaxID=859 RepID=UPI000786CC6D|nr:hypothetical protein [Fusobacterium necrophorum]KYM41123.1 hypothetical protein A2U15_09690 [Fusobacterium necrophorum subsp. funduliforme]KYM48758.1 hypothetical protein A2U11_11035 [Fusobacterium necrophorum subsp. funduliforme]KYM57641.1 hypothetical protein A2U07_08940 [Fusobacterium necrophorum subsp. funduliforme]KYM61095.1 hypothetical protein A2U09_10945 [Fusobacterium necrophorum subsp. funduliforme]MDK4477555.1 hypothetical protein [Fusobacterium necrophorum]
MSVTLASVFGSTIGKKVIDKVLDVIGKKIPMSADQRQHLEVELAKMEVEGIRARSEYVKSLGTRIRDGIIPLTLFGFFLMHFMVFLSDFINANLGKEVPIIMISPEYTKVTISIVAFLFPYKGYKIYEEHKSLRM